MFTRVHTTMALPKLRPVHRVVGCTGRMGRVQVPPLALRRRCVSFVAPCWKRAARAPRRDPACLNAARSCRNRVFNTAIKRLAFAGRYNEALAALEARALVRDVPTRHLNTLLRGVALASHDDCCRRAMTLIKTAGVDVQSVNREDVADALLLAVKFADSAEVMAVPAVAAAAADATAVMKAGGRPPVVVAQELRREKMRAARARQAPPDAADGASGADEGADSRRVEELSGAAWARQQVSMFDSRRHRLERALAIARAGEEAGIALNARSFAFLLSAAVASDDVDTAWRLWEEAQRKGTMSYDTVWSCMQIPFVERLLDAGVLDREQWAAVAPVRGADGEWLLAGQAPGRRSAALFAMAAEAAWRGDQPGEKHGAVIVEGEAKVLAVGYNHYQGRSVIHAEQHALQLCEEAGVLDRVQDSPDVRMHLVELDGDVTYEDSVPCGMCTTAILRRKLRHVCYSAGDGGVQSLDFSF